MEAARQIAREYGESTVWFSSLAGTDNAAEIAGIVRDDLGLPSSPNTTRLRPWSRRFPGSLRFWYWIISSICSVPPAMARPPSPRGWCRHCSQAFLTHLPADLAATRGPLAEREFALSPLPTPASDLVTPEHLRDCASVALFLDRAQAAQSDFQLTRRNAPAIARLCARLEVSRWQSSSPPPAPRSSRRLRCWSGSKAVSTFCGAEARCLPAPSDASGDAGLELDLLRPDLRRFFSALSALRGSWTAEAAWAVAAGENSRDTVLDLISELQACSLLQADGDPRKSWKPCGPAKNRRRCVFACWKPVREYAAEKLPLGRAYGVRGTACGVLRGSCRAERTSLTSRESGLFAGWLDADRDNFEAALAWTLKANAVELGLRIGGALWWRWVMRADTAQGRVCLARILDMDARLPEQTPARAALRARALNCAGMLASVQGDHDAARAALEAAVAIWRELGDPHRMASALNSLGSAARARGDLEAARVFLEESRQIWGNWTSRAASSSLSIIWRASFARRATWPAPRRCAGRR
jgi:non-specific serine/threonine protein kinase